MTELSPQEQAARRHALQNPTLSEARSRQVELDHLEKTGTWLDGPPAWATEWAQLMMSTPALVATTVAQAAQARAYRAALEAERTVFTLPVHPEGGQDLWWYWSAIIEVAGTVERDAVHRAIQGIDFQDASDEGTDSDAGRQLLADLDQTLTAAGFTVLSVRPAKAVMFG